MFENPRRGRQTRNFTTIVFRTDIFRKLPLGAPEYSSVWSRVVDLEERGRAKAGELWDVALEEGLKHFLVWKKLSRRSVETSRWGEGYHVNYQQKTGSLSWSYPRAWWSYPISYWGENNRKRQTGRPRAGKLDRVKDSCLTYRSRGAP